METPLSFSPKLFLLLLITFLLFQHWLSSSSMNTFSTTTDSLDFIRSKCNTTLYPDLCYTSLSRYANAVSLDPAQLARFSIGITLVQAHRATILFSNMTRRADYGLDPRAASAFHDCSSTFGEAVDQMRGSLKEITKLTTATNLGSATPEAVRFQLSNVQTWMSAALTNEDTCSDGFVDVEDCPVKEQVGDKVVMFKEYTSNALALVNSFAQSVNSR